MHVLFTISQCHNFCCCCFEGEFFHLDESVQVKGEVPICVSLLFKPHISLPTSQTSQSTSWLTWTSHLSPVPGLKTSQQIAPHKVGPACASTPGSLQGSHGRSVYTTVSPLTPSIQSLNLQMIPLALGSSVEETRQCTERRSKSCQVGAPNKTYCSTPTKQKRHMDSVIHGAVFSRFPPLNSKCVCVCCTLYILF